MNQATISNRIAALEDAIEIRSCELLLEQLMPWIAHRLGVSVEQAQPIKDTIRRDVFPPPGVSLDTWKRTHLRPLNEDTLDQGKTLMEEFAAWEAEQGRAA